MSAKLNKYEWDQLKIEPKMAAKLQLFCMKDYVDLQLSLTEQTDP